jgi:hypothetical protein
VENGSAEVDRGGFEPRAAWHSSICCKLGGLTRFGMALLGIIAAQPIYSITGTSCAPVARRALLISTWQARYVHPGIRICFVPCGVGFRRAVMAHAMFASSQAKAGLRPPTSVSGP